MFRRLRRNFTLKTKSINLESLAKTLPGLALACTVALIPAFGQNITIDGKTNTTLNTNGITTNISTSTVRGENAYNSFIKFNVNTGQVVNLNVPDSCTGLINLIHNEATTINGVLNSVKSGQIGGNIFLVNPHGITVGSQGVVNVGSLTTVTPTTD